MHVKAPIENGCEKASLMGMSTKAMSFVSGSQLARLRESMPEFLSVLSRRLWSEEKSIWKPDAGMGPRTMPSVQQGPHRQ